MLQAARTEAELSKLFGTKVWTLDVEIEDLVFALQGSGLHLVLYFFTVPLFLLFGMLICICLVGVCNLLFQGFMVKRVFESQKRS